MSEKKNKPKEDKPTPHYVMISRRLIRVWIGTTITLFLLFGLSIQYTNYVDTRSNRYWCGIVAIFNDTYKKSPPPTEIGKILAEEFKHLPRDFKCK